METILLTEVEPKKILAIKDILAWITLHKVIVNIEPYPGNEKWLGILQKADINLNITHFTEKGTHSTPISLLARVRPSYNQPVFDFIPGEVFPIANKHKDLIRLPPSTLSLEMVLTKQNGINISLSVLFDKTPGVDQVTTSPHPSS